MKQQLAIWLIWARLAAVLAGIAAVVIGVVLAVRYMATPAILLEHAGPPAQDQAVVNPGALRSLSPYAASRQPRGQAPSGPRSGEWIEIPAVSIALPLRDGDGSNNIPDWVALRYPGTAPPGSPGNSYIYAHGLWGMFGALLFAKEGQQVNLHNYTTGIVEVFHISRVVGNVKWNDVSYIYQHSDVPQLTIQTCVGASINTDRWVVQAT